MSVHIRRALEAQLDAMTPALATAWENTAYTPTIGTPYQRVALLRASPDNSMKGPNSRFELGVFQVSLFYPTGAGPALADARAEAVREQFKRTTTLVSGSVRTIITHTPSIAPALADAGWYVVPISIRYQTEISG